MTSRFRSPLLILAVLFSAQVLLRADPPLHREVLVFVPAYEASQLFDPTLRADPSAAPPCVWGSLNVFFSSKLYFALRLPNPLAARTLLSVGPVDIYQKFVSSMISGHDDVPKFAAYTEGADFFVFPYDWRLDISTASAPQLGRALEDYARIHEQRTGLPACETRFIIVTHSMGGLVVRTLLGEQPQWASRISRLYLVGSPNGGSVKAIRTVVVGPDSLKARAQGFPGILLNLLPTDVDQNVTKLTGITRPTLYELLPLDDPNWKRVRPDGTEQRMTASDVVQAGSWEDYWPSAGLEQRLFLKGWLKDRQAEGRKEIHPADWEYCQDPGFSQLKKLLAQTRDLRRHMGTIQHTAALLARPGEPTRLRLVLSTGIETPSGVVSGGLHDAAWSYYTYSAGDEGDGTMETSRVLDGLAINSPNVKLLQKVPHGRLMIDPQFLSYFETELAGAPLLSDAHPAR